MCLSYTLNISKTKTKQQQQKIYTLTNAHWHDQFSHYLRSHATHLYADAIAELTERWKKKKRRSPLSLLLKMFDEFLVEFVVFHFIS